MSTLEHRAQLDAYTPVVKVREHNGRRTAIKQTRYVVRCSCGWSVSGLDYINARRSWKRHTGRTP